MVVCPSLRTLAPVFDSAAAFSSWLIYLCFHDFSRATRDLRAHFVFRPFFFSRLGQNLRRYTALVGWSFWPSLEEH